MSKFALPHVQTISVVFEPNQPKLDQITKQVLVLLEGMGLVWPVKIDPDSIKQFPLDLTQISLLELGELHSYWIAHHSRAMVLAGNVVGQKRSLKHQTTRMRRLAAGGDEVSTGLLRKLEEEQIRVEVLDANLGGLVECYKRYVEACSREITRRQIEASLER